MNRIKDQLETIKTKKKIGLMTHVIVGYPSLEATEEIIMAMVDEGVDMIELQIPFSDPVADGPTILKASEQALANGVSVDDAFALVKKLRDQGVKIPLLFMTYANIVMARGIEKFFAESANVGIDGFILPDFPFDTPEGQKCFCLAKENNQQMIPLYAPTMSDDRFKFLASYTQDLLYAVSRTGVTGTKGVSTDLTKYLQKIKSITDGKIALGFGIQSAKQVSDLQGKCDIAVIGTHILRLYQEGGIELMRKFLQEITGK